MARSLILDAYCSSEHYWRHIENVWAALPAAIKGKAYAPKASCSWGEPLPPRWPRDRIVLVASYVDSLKCRPRGYVLVGHGADQRYDGDLRSADNPSYAGGDHHERCVLFLCPSQRSADAWATRYPGVPAVAVGCAFLDPWHRRMLMDGAPPPL